MTHDPIVEEIHQTRKRIFEECDSDMEKLIARLREAEANDRARMVTIDDVRERTGRSKERSPEELQAERQ